MAASPARRIAFEVLRRVEAEQAYASDVLHARLAKGVSRPDAGLATELTFGVLRWQRLLDFLIQRHLDRNTSTLDSEVLIALRLGAYQMRFLDRVPARAAVNDSVELVKLAKKRSAAPLVNAVLRKFGDQARIDSARIAEWIPSKAPEGERLAILHSHPTWIVDRWIKAFGRDRTVELLQANNRPARTSCAVVDPEQTADVAKSLQEEGFQVAPSLWLVAAFAISGGNPSESKNLLAGRISVQDEASQMVARLLDARSGDLVLDLCAAPGGKTGIIARSIAPQGSVIAADVHLHRIREARDQLKRTRTSQVEWLALDAMEPLPFSKMFSRILLDAPCSGTGTLARNPEIRWRLQPEDLDRAHRRQVAMLRRALRQLDRGGRLLYATCSLEPEENESVIRTVLQEEPALHVVRTESALRPWLRDSANPASLFDAQDCFRTFSPETGTDGFFAAALEWRS